MNRTYPLYNGATFRLEAFVAFLEQLRLLDRWCRTQRTGRLALNDKTLKQFSWHPQLEQLRQVRKAIQQLRKPSFLVWNGRNYYDILPFKAETSRNSPKRCTF
jgi:hypothetical protein